MKKLIWVTTVAQSMELFKGQLKFLSEYFDLAFVSSNENDLSELMKQGEREGVKVHELPMKREISLFTDIKSLILFIKYFLEEKPDAVHGNTPKGGLLAMCTSKLTGVKTRIYMCHGLRYQGCIGAKRKLLMAMERLACLCATHVLCVSAGLRETLEVDGICSMRKSILIGNGSCNGINMSQFDPLAYSATDKRNLRKQYNIEDDEFLFIYMGRIVSDKGINEMINAFTRYHKENKKVRLIMLGAFEDSLNPVDSSTAEFIKGNKEGIVYCGKQADVKPYLAASQCLLLPSYREGFGLVLMEAGAMSLPVISSDIIGCNNVVTSENGLLVTPRDIESLYQKMKMMVEDSSKYQYLLSSTRKSIEERFEQTLLWNKFLAFYQSVI